MNKLLVAIFASAFAFFSASALAQVSSADNTMKPLSQMQTKEAQAARKAAQEKWAKMTPEEREAAKKAAREKRLSDASAIDMVANEFGSMGYDAKEGKAEAAASKALPKPTKEQRAKDLQEQQKKSSGQ